MPEISVVIPTYNRPAKLRRALVSCFRQSILPGEVIVVDNGVNPETKTVINEFQAAHPERVLYAQSEPYKGRAAIARGLELVTKDWVINLDDDDFLAPDRIECDLNMISRISSHVIMISHDFVRVDYGANLVWHHRLTPAKLTLESALTLDHFGPPPSATWRSDIIKRYHPFRFEEGWFDYDLISSLLQHGEVEASGRVGYIMDDTRNTVRETLSSDKPVRLVMLHGERYKDVPTRFGIDPGKVQRRIAEQISFHGGKILRWRMLTSPYARHALTHPIEFLKGVLSPLRYPATRLFGTLLPVMRGSSTASLRQFEKQQPALGAWIREYSQPSL